MRKEWRWEKENTVLVFTWILCEVAVIKGLILHALHFNGWYYNFPLSGYSNQNETFFTEFFRDFHRLGRDFSIKKK